MTIRDQSTRTLGEALALGLRGDPTPGYRHTPRTDRQYEALAERILAASPTVARRLDFATAWDESVAECKRLGWVFDGLSDLSDRSDWGAYAYEPMTEDGTSHEAGQQTEEGHGPDETAALVALTAALRDRAR